MHGQRHAPAGPTDQRRDDAWFADITSQLTAYFKGDLVNFDVPLRLDGTEFQCDVWSHLRDIPYGETISYGELARRVGNPNASRAVGLANGRNPIAIIVPCHRVIGSTVNSPATAADSIARRGFSITRLPTGTDQNFQASLLGRV